MFSLILLSLRLLAPHVFSRFFHRALVLFLFVLFKNRILRHFLIVFGLKRKLTSSFIISFSLIFIRFLISLHLDDSIFYSFFLIFILFIISFFQVSKKHSTFDVKIHPYPTFTTKSAKFYFFMILRSLFFSL